MLMLMISHLSVEKSDHETPEPLQSSHNIDILWLSVCFKSNWSGFFSIGVAVAQEGERVVR